MSKDTNLGQEIATTLLEKLNPDLFYSRRGGNPDEGGRLRFGLTGALDEVTAQYAEKSSDANGLKVAHLRIVQAFIQAREPEYLAPFITDTIRDFERGTGDERSYRQHLLLGKSAERLAAPRLLENLKQHYHDSIRFRLQEGRPALFLPDNWLESMLEDIQTYIDFWRSEEDTQATDQETRELFSLDLDANNAATRTDCLEKFEYDKEITEPWIETSKAAAILQFNGGLKAKEKQRMQRLANIYSIRQGALENDPFMEYAIRLQMKIIPQLGRQLDEEFFWLSSRANALIPNQDCEHTPFMWNRQMIDIPSYRSQ